MHNDNALFLSESNLTLAQVLGNFFSKQNRRQAGFFVEWKSILSLSLLQRNFHVMLSSFCLFLLVATFFLEPLCNALFALEKIPREIGLSMKNSY